MIPMAGTLGSLGQSWRKHGETCWGVSYVAYPTFAANANDLAMNIRLSQKDVEAFGREKEAIAMSDGTGYVGTLNVFHELHCVVRRPCKAKN